MFSADSTGLIIVWKTPVTNDQQPDPCHQWCIDMVQDLTMLDYKFYVHFIAFWQEDAAKPAQSHTYSSKVGVDLCCTIDLD